MGDEMFGWRIFHVYSAGGLASALQINSYCSYVARSSVFFGVVIVIFRGFHLTLTEEKKVSSDEHLVPLVLYYKYLWRTRYLSTVESCGVQQYSEIVSKLLPSSSWWLFPFVTC